MPDRPFVGRAARVLPMIVVGGNVVLLGRFLVHSATSVSSFRFLLLPLAAFVALLAASAVVLGRTGIAGVANIGTDRNWSGSHFDQANWYAFGRLAWNPALPAEDIANEWVRMTFGNVATLVARVCSASLFSGRRLGEASGS